MARRRRGGGAVEEAVFRIILDPTPVEDALKQVRNEGRKTAADVQKSFHGSARKEVSALTSGLQRFKGVLEPTATATSGVASALGGLGGRAGATFGALSNLTSVMMAGGPLALAFIGITSLSAALVNRYQEMKQAAEETRVANEEFARALAEGLDSQIEESSRSLESLTDRIRSFGQKGHDVTLKAARANQAAAQEQLTRHSEREQEIRSKVAAEEERIAELRRGARSSSLAAAHIAEQSLGEMRKELAVVEERVTKARDLVNQRQLELGAAQTLAKLIEDEEKRQRAIAWAKERQAELEREAHERSLRVLSARKEQLSIEQQIAKDVEARNRRRGAMQSDLDERVKRVEENMKAVADVEEAYRRRTAAREAAHQRALRDMSLSTVEDYEAALAQAKSEHAAAAAGVESALAAAHDAASGGLGAEARLRDAQRLVDERVRIEEEAAGRILDISQKLEEQRRELAEQTSAATQASWDMAVSAGQGALSAGLGAFQGYLDGIITGQEKAAEAALAAFLAQTGGQLVGIGTKAVWEGAIMSANPLTPGAGIPLMAIGAGAIAVGVGMGAAGTAVGHVAAGGRPGVALDGPGGGGSSSVSSSRGVSSPSSTRAMGSERSESHYHFHGPVFDYNGSARAVRELYDHEQNELLGSGRRR